jgi:MFS superfamily sulfate permease-like transporter
MAVGLICLLGWIGRLGFLANLLSRPVLIGYMNRIALLMIVRQLGNLTGAPVDGGSVTHQLRSVVTPASRPSADSRRGLRGTRDVDRASIRRAAARAGR